MTPISALAILFCIYAVSELIAQKTKAIFSTVLSIAILLLAGFWSGILPRTLIDDAQITGFGNIIAAAKWRSPAHRSSQAAAQQRSS